MATIIDFQVKNTKGYENLVQLFAVCGSVENCNYYLETVEYMAEHGQINENELLTLRRIGRMKRQELANLIKKPEIAKKPGIYNYAPEMGEQKPEGVQIEARSSYYGDHWFLYTELELKGRGITLIETKNDIYKYKVTNRAFDLLKEKYCISQECILD